MKSWKKADWFWVALAATAGYLLVAIALIGPTRAWGFITTEGKLNEVGDFLAGLFSPLAFIWLVAAVLTQRQELNVTREQFEENKTVVREQLATIDGQNDLLATQQRHAEASARQTYKLNLFERRLEIYDRLIEIHNELAIDEIDSGTVARLRKLALMSAFIFSGNIQQYISDIGNRAEAYDLERSQILVSNGVGGRIFSGAPEHRSIAARLTVMKESIRESLGEDELLLLMWSSMRVSDDD